MAKLHHSNYSFYTFELEGTPDEYCTTKVNQIKKRSTEKVNQHTHYY